MSTSIFSSSSSSPSSRPLSRKLLLLLPLLSCLYFLTDDDYRRHDDVHVVVPTNNDDQDDGTLSVPLAPLFPRHHLAFATALSRHPPSLRVFRLFFEAVVLLACASFALRCWENGDDDDDDDVVRIAKRDVGRLLFRPPPDAVESHSAWKAVATHRRRRRRRRRRREGEGREKDERERGHHLYGKIGTDCEERQRERDGQSRQRTLADADADEEEEEEEEAARDLGADSSWEKLSPSSRQNDEDDRDHDDDRAEKAHNDDGVDEMDDDLRDLIEIPPTPPRPLPSSSRRRQTFDDDDEDDDQKHDHEGADPHATKETPPSASSVMGAALDLLAVTCVFLILFTASSAEGGRYIDKRAGGATFLRRESGGGADAGKFHLYGPGTVEEGTADANFGGDSDAHLTNTATVSWMEFFADVAAPLFPLTLFAMGCVAVVVPWKKRKGLWTMVSLTVGAPFYEVTFRDGFIGDILTSTVRPLQDLVFTLFFLPLGLRAWWSSAFYTMDAAAIPMERNWLLHTVLLPACTLSPLWWRFLQNLRQCFDAKKRWPYLGNAFKYLMAAEVATFGMFDPSAKTHPLWMACFFVATLYQVWWDVFMDWGLLERDSFFGFYHLSYHFKNNNGYGLFWWWPYSLRSQRLYKRRWIYYVIFVINFCLRFVGMVTLIPPVYLSRSTGLIVNTYDPDFQLFLGSLAASAEIFRRTIWALLRVEWEVIRTSNEKQKSVIHVDSKKYGGMQTMLGDKEDMKPMEIGGGNVRRRMLPFGSRGSFSLESLSDMSNLNDIQILTELCVWATVFSGLAIVAAAHREVL